MKFTKKNAVDNNSVAILFSIKHAYVEKIFSGEKKCEFRKTRCKNEVKKALVYETYPKSLVIGEFEITSIVEEAPEALWIRTCSYAGLDKQAFDRYYEGSRIAVAYMISNPIRYTKPISINEYGLKRPPQSYAYVKI